MLPRPFHISRQSFVGLFYTKLSVSRANFSPLNWKASKSQVFENLLRISGALLSTTPPSYLEAPETQFSCKCLAILQSWPNMAIIYYMWLKFKENRRHQLFNFPEYWLIWHGMTLMVNVKYGPINNTLRATIFFEFWGHWQTVIFKLCVSTLIPTWTSCPTIFFWSWSSWSVTVFLALCLHVAICRWSIRRRRRHRVLDSPGRANQGIWILLVHKCWYGALSPVIICSDLRNNFWNIKMECHDKPVLLLECRVGGIGQI